MTSFVPLSLCEQGPVSLKSNVGSIYFMLFHVGL